MKKEARILSLFAIIICSNLLILFSNNNFNTNKPNNNDVLDNDVPEISNGATDSRVIVYFNDTSYNASVISNFTYHGGIINKEWTNNTFANISVFAGTIPTANITLFEGNITDAIVDIDEIIETQMNYATVQSGAVNSTWQQNGYMGSINSSIAILDTGINPNHPFFPEGYNSTYLTGNIVGWEDFVNQNTDPSDDNGHGSFISSVIAGTGTTNSTNSTIMSFYGNYSHAELFPGEISPTNYSIKLASFNASQENSNIILNSSWHLIEGGFNGFWFDLYFNNTKVNSSKNVNADTLYELNHNIAQDDGLYDLFLVYHKDLSGAKPKFTFTVNISFYPENYTANFKSFTGMANATKIVSYKILNQTGIGYASDLIDALVSVMYNKSQYHIISVCLSVASFGEDANAINAVIDEVIANGTLVVIAAGNKGTLTGSDPLNILATNKNAIVVGAINDMDQVTVYSSMGREVGNDVIKPDIVAPGGSTLQGQRSIIAADYDSNKTTAAYGTSIATAIVSAAINILIEAKWGDWNNWNSLDLDEWVKLIKSTLLLTASESNQLREDDPDTSVVESNDSPSTYLRGSLNLKDAHEGYGRLNVQAAIDALTKTVDVNINSTMNGTITSSEINPLGDHVFARRVILNKSITYLFNLTIQNPLADFDMFLFSNESNSYGEPILIESARNLIELTSTQFYFTPDEDETESILVVKAVSRESAFDIHISNVSNQYAPVLSVPEIRDEGNNPLQNSTVLSYQKYIGFPKDKNYTLDQYMFYIKYSDNDTGNAPPKYINVSIEGINYTLTRAYINENNFTEGVTYTSIPITLNTSGIYNYYFVTSDGIHSARYPLAGTLNIQIEDPVYKDTPYEHNFGLGLDNWDLLGTGWDTLFQINGNDDRVRLYDDPPFLPGLGSWSTIYFGRYHNLPLNYTYQPIIPLSEDINGSVISPWFNLTGITNPIVKFGIRVSINALDSIDLYIIHERWGQEELLKSYSNEESEWDMDEFNLSEYMGELIQFRFEANLFALPDVVKNRGFMLDYVAIENYTNDNAPEIVVNGLPQWNRVEPPSSTGGSRYQQFYFTCEVRDIDGNYPEQVILEFGPNGETPGPEFEMLNIYGDFDVNSTSYGDYGILFRKAVVAGSISNRSFRFKVFDGEHWAYSSDSLGWFPESEIVFSNPTPLQFNYEDPASGKDIAYLFANDNLDDYYVGGYPNPGEYTAWLAADNTWHPINQGGQDLLYCGVGQVSYTLEDIGYGYNWNAELMTRPLYVPGDHKVYLEFVHNISYDNEPDSIPQLFIFYPWNNDKDRGYISISTDYGNSWTPLGLEYYYDSTDGYVKLDISSYSEQVIMIKFTFYSNVYDGLFPGTGWTVYNISIGYDKDSDFVAPVVLITNPTDLSTVSSTITISALLTDNKEIDISRIAIYINDTAIDENLFTYNNDTGILTYECDTWQYTDGLYEITIVVFDEEGNRAEATIVVYIDNGLIDVNKWWPWIVLILITIIVIISLYLFMEKKGKYMISRRREYKIEKIRTANLGLEAARKNIESINPEVELARPYTLHCKFCKTWYSSNEFDIMCPQCDHDQIYAAYICSNCNKWHFKETPGEEYYCKKCTGVRLIRQDREIVESLLENKGKIVRDYVFSKDKQTYSILD